MSRLRRLVSLPFRHPRLSLGVVLLTVSLGLGAVQGAGYLRYRRHLNAAKEAIARYDFEPAHRQLAECLRWRPDDPALLLLAARTARRADRLDEAEDLLNRLRRLRGQPDPESALEHALLQAQRGQLQLVEEDLLERLNDDPDRNLILEALALGCVKVYRTDKAMMCLHRLLEEDPDYLPARLLRGKLFESMGKMGAAVADYRKAVGAYPENGRACLRLAEGLLKEERYHDAATHFERLLRGGEHRPAALLGLARCLLQQQRREEARRLLDELLTQAPADGNGLRERGKLALVEGELADAERLLRGAVAAQPYDREAVFQLSVCLRRRGQTAEADNYQQRVKQMETDLRRLEVLFPQTVSQPEATAPRLELGRICLRNGHEFEAQRWLNSVLQLDPHNRAAHRGLAEIYRHRDDNERAREHLRLAGDLPTNP